MAGGQKTGSWRRRSYLRGGLTAFVFHEVTNQPSEFQRRASIFTPPMVFEKQIRWIRNRFEVISPTQLEQLGGIGAMPENAALITFDDSWAGTFRTGLALLETLHLPALCFVNTATVDGAPDLAAVRHYEQLHPRGPGLSLERPHDSTTARALLEEITETYQTDSEFAHFQGPTATADDLARAVRSDSVWFGLHLHHHWDLALVNPELARSSLRVNADALRCYGHVLPAFAPPYGRVVPWLDQILNEVDVKLVFLAAGGQNSSPGSSSINRIVLPDKRGGAAELWYVTHRRRLAGRMVGRWSKPPQNSGSLCQN
jgi:peptidoglycan/xylan/chitin deacetylase (PgdA/CDA1 family)